MWWVVVLLAASVIELVCCAGMLAWVGVAVVTHIAEGSFNVCGCGGMSRGDEQRLEIYQRWEQGKRTGKAKAATSQ